MCKATHCGARVADVSRHRAFSIIYIGLSLFAMLAIISLAVDMGRLRVARVQLGSAADASALAGAQKVPLGFSDNLASAQSAAIAVAVANVAIQGTGNAVPVNLEAVNDIQFGYFDTSTGIWTVAGSSYRGHTVVNNECNAAHVTARRIAARGTSVGLFFARAIGLNTMDIASEAIAVVRGRRFAFGIVGLDSFIMNGNTLTDSYNPALGAYGGTNVHWNGSVASNGTITMVGTGDIYGDARPGPGFWVNQNGITKVHGWIAPLDAPLDFPPKTVPA